MEEQTPRAATSFGAVAQAYDRGRPGYPEAAVRWLIGRDAAQVLELGAGTGKLTETLVAHGHDVLATDVDEQMLQVLRERVPGARAAQAPAEELPVGDRSVDVVVAAQCFHWFDHPAALREIARVLRPGGVLALTWNLRDERIPWVRRLGALIGTAEQLDDPTETIAESGLFEATQAEQFSLWQDINSESLVDLVASRSNVATLPPEQRAAKLAEVVAFYDTYGRGYDGMQLPYRTTCYRARSLDPLSARPAGAGDETQDSRPGGIALGRHNDGSDTDLLLIDFR